MAEEAGAKTAEAEADAAKRQTDAVLWCIVMLCVIVASALIGKVSPNQRPLERIGFAQRDVAVFLFVQYVRGLPEPPSSLSGSGSGSGSAPATAPGSAFGAKGKARSCKDDEKDDDACLVNTPGWGSHHCAPRGGRPGVKKYCGSTKYAEVLKCCPVTCGTCLDTHGLLEGFGTTASAKGKARSPSYWAWLRTGLVRVEPIRYEK